MWGQFWHKLSKQAFESCICQGILDFQADTTLKVLPEWCIHSKLGHSCALVFVSREAQGGLKKSNVLSPELIFRQAYLFFFPINASIFAFCISQEALGVSPPEA